jgi:hypothetical protein
MRTAYNTQKLADEDIFLAALTIFTDNGTLRKTPFLSHFIPKTIILPRQARDKHRENSIYKEACCAGAATLGAGWTPRPGTVAPPVAPGPVGPDAHDLGPNVGYMNWNWCGNALFVAPLSFGEE